MEKPVDGSAGPAPEAAAPEGKHDRSPPRSRRRVARGFAIIAVNALLLLAADQIFGRLLSPSSPQMTRKQLMSECYPSNYRGYFKAQRTGDDGETCWTIDRAQETDRLHARTRFVDPNLKILAIGDSFTYGLGVRLEDTYVKVLERAPSKVKVYGLTTATPGADVADALQQIRRVPPSVKLNVVIYGYVLNDPLIEPIGATSFVSPDGNKPASWNLIYVPERQPERARWVQSLMARSYLFTAAVDAYERNDMTQRTVQYYKDLHDPARNGPGLTRTFTMIEQMKESATRHGARFVVAIFPIFHWSGKRYPFEREHAYLAKTLGERGIDVIDLRPAYDGYDPKDLWVHPCDHHPNDLAQKLAAGRIETWLREQKILPP